MGTIATLKIGDNLDSEFKNLNKDYTKLGRIYRKLHHLDHKTNLSGQSNKLHDRNLPRSLNKKEEKICPKREGDLYKDYYGKDHSNRCREKCQPNWKLKDYIDAFNDMRTGNNDFETKCKQLLLDPLIKKVEVPKQYKERFPEKTPYKNCNMSNYVFIDGRS